VRKLSEGAWLAPGFLDVQVNGGGDVLFNDTPTPEGILAIASAHRKFGTTSLLPTLISDTPDQMRKALDAVQALVGKEPSVLGVHLEGPFLSPEKAGVHNTRALRPPTGEDMMALTRPRQGVIVVTLARSRCRRGLSGGLWPAISEYLSDTRWHRTRKRVLPWRKGARGFTDLFNAMPPLASREGGPIAAALETPDCWYGLIVDGVHVHPALLRLALRGAGHPMLVTDAMPPVGGVRQSFALYSEEITVRDGRCTRCDGRLAGSCLNMATAVRNCVILLNVPLEQALRFASGNPATFIGVGHWLGRLAPHYRADMVALDPRDVRVLATWVAGRSS
jgi:N-acetylglucosamine-6-phosphate deacetylase